MRLVRRGGLREWVERIVCDACSWLAPLVQKENTTVHSALTMKTCVHRGNICHAWIGILRWKESPRNVRYQCLIGPLILLLKAAEHDPLQPLRIRLLLSEQPLPHDVERNLRRFRTRVSVYSGTQTAECDTALFLGR